MYGSVKSMKDYVLRVSTDLHNPKDRVDAYQELAKSPETLDDARGLIERHGSDEHLCRIAICQLPCQQSPVLSITSKMRVDLDPGIVF